MRTWPAGQSHRRKANSGGVAVTKQESKVQGQ